MLLTNVHALTLLYNYEHCKQIKVISLSAQTKHRRQKMNKTENLERFFSVELKSKANLKNVTLTNGGHDNVLVEGTLGELVQAGFAEGVILEVVGSKGVLRINLGEEEIKKTPVQNCGAVKTP
jgi:hypothetical protein